ncbi:MAG: hypothetical protein NC253_12260 [Ruminococcus sp.]|nr:hypothetical protein [Ruminococcus sp.]MCM1380633.1 hypothetical protein [Muribaculaceae bacterium]MCM1478375.1 hypothetical protein [Muribaculaceae bacterium]
MKRKFFAVILAAVLSAVCGFTAYADEYSDYSCGWEENEPVYYDKNGEPITGLYYGYINGYINSGDWDEEDIFEGLKDRQTYMYNFNSDGTVNCLYTGFTSNSKGKRYYCDGRRVLGWYKTKEGWRHFGGEGYMSTGKTEICGTNYYFDENGVWTGKFGKNGKAPDDFNLRFRYNTELGIEGFDSGSSEVFYGSKLWEVLEDGYLVGNQSEKIRVSQRDRQILYCMFLESGFSETDLSRPLNGEYLYEFMDKHNKDENGYIKDFESAFYEDGEVCEITVTANGKTYSVKYGGSFIGQLSGKDETAGAVVFFGDSLSYYNGVLRGAYPQQFNKKPLDYTAEYDELKF